MALRDAIVSLQSKALSLPGIKEAPIDPPESANQFPFAISYVRAGTWHIESSGFSHAQVQLVTELHGARTLLPTDIQTMLPFFEQFLRKLLADQTLGGAVDNIGNVDFSFGVMEYGVQGGVPIQTIGWQFVLSGPDGAGVKVTIT